MPLETITVRPIGALVKVTDRCNFKCCHCGQCEPGTYDMPVQDMAHLVNSLNNPLFSDVTFYGGEPRVNSQLPQLIDTTSDLVCEAGKPLAVNIGSTPSKAAYQVTSRSLDQLTASKKAALNSSRELRARLYTEMLSLKPQDQSPLSVTVFTNGFGMKDEDATANIVRSLTGHGVNNITVSLDPPHREFASQHNIPIDYPLLEKLTASHDKTFNAKHQISLNTSYGRGGNGKYVIPVGRARDFSWPRRISLAHDDFTPETIRTIQKSLMDTLNAEFNDWPHVESFSHCYCTPAYLRRSYLRAQKYSPENRAVFPLVAVDANLDVNPCGFDIMPPLGNLRNNDISTIYHLGANNRLYQILDEEGPHGLAKRLTHKSWAQVHSEFLERTPCGLCEDLCREHPAAIANLLHTIVR